MERRQYDVFATGVVIGRILKPNAAPVGTTVDMDLGFGYHENRTPTHGFEATGEAAMAAFQELAARASNLRAQSARRR
jgi:hypothetical protein